MPPPRHRGIVPPRVERVAQAQFAPFVGSRALAIVKIDFGARPTFSTPILQYFGAEHGTAIRFGYVDRSQIKAYAVWSHKHLGSRFAKRPTRAGAAPDGYYLFRHSRLIAFHAGANSDPATSLATMAFGAAAGALASSSPWSTALRAFEHQEAACVIPAFEAALQTAPPMDQETAAPSGQPSTRPVDPFGVLRIPSTASDEEVKGAYHKQLLLNHPDLTAKLSPAIQLVAHEESVAINAAYKTIIDRRARK